MSKEILSDLKEQLKKSVTALKANNCAINADFILSNGKVYVLEIGLRTGATCLAEMVSLHYGIDYYKYILDSVLGHKLQEFREPQDACFAEVIISPETGRLDNVSYQADRDQENIYDISFDYEAGEQVRAFRVGPDRIGQIILHGKDVNLLKNQIQEIKSNMKIAVM